MHNARIETIINYYELNDGLVSSGDAATRTRNSSDNMRVATSGQPSSEEFAAIHDAGYQVIINLVPTDAEMALVGEKEIVENLGMSYIHIPVIWNSPQVSDIEKFFDAMQNNRDKRVFVHCEVNYRASSFMYLYRRKFLGVDETQARQDLQWIWSPNPTWRKFIQEVESS